MDSTIKETNLLIELIRKTNIDKETLAAVQEAVREAFKHQPSNPIDLEILENGNDDISRAVKHTLELYKNTGPSKETYHGMANRIQESYRAYGVRRNNPNEFCKPTKHVKEAKRVILDVDEDDQGSCPATFRTSGLRTVSSTTLAGSYMHLPKYRPYSPHDSNPLMDLQENTESIHIKIDYTGIGNTREDSTEDDISESPETVIELHHVNEENYNDKNKIKKNSETYKEDPENSQDEDDVQEELSQAHNDETSDGSIGEVVYEHNIDEVEEVLDYISDYEE
ncbi:hypothetical protein K1T71_009088 [Dendrolimus kikuchii]|uniref:Uncharacterized protein n=1 Tax=Dendrolimus kikuchii TaxID=765133 RepID=A0ACC1CTK9_9NEOP|nr:hypothetical protein K1T71_009088 [Dendrolimus kikuchii]